MGGPAMVTAVSARALPVVFAAVAASVRASRAAVVAALAAAVAVVAALAAAAAVGLAEAAEAAEVVEAAEVAVAVVAAADRPIRDRHPLDYAKEPGIPPGFSLACLRRRRGPLIRVKDGWLPPWQTWAVSSACVTAGTA
jgi:lysylphosphatidylglycerol synthetase-like protein (DUF2156 family)